MKRLLIFTMLVVLSLIFPNLSYSQISFEKTTNYYRSNKVADFVGQIYFSRRPSDAPDFIENAPFKYKSDDSVKVSYDYLESKDFYAKALLKLTFDQQDNLLDIKMLEFSSVVIRNKEISTGEKIIFVNYDTVGYTQDEIRNMKEGIGPNTLKIINHIFEVTKKRKFKKPSSFPLSDFTDRNETELRVFVNRKIFHDLVKKELMKD